LLQNNTRYRLGISTVRTAYSGEVPAHDEHRGGDGAGARSYGIRQVQLGLVLGFGSLWCSASAHFSARLRLTLVLGARL
jgi:hypothetical protein